MKRVIASDNLWKVMLWSILPVMTFLCTWLEWTVMQQFTEYTLVLDVTNLQFYQLITYGFTHHDFSHLFTNIIGYVLLFILLLFLDVDIINVGKHFLTSSSLFLIFNALLQVLFVKDFLGITTEQGASGLILLLSGMVLLELSHSIWDEEGNIQAPWLASFLVLLILTIPSLLPHSTSDGTLINYVTHCFGFLFGLIYYWMMRR